MMKLSGLKTGAVYRRHTVGSVADLAEGVARLAALHGMPGGGRTVVPIALVAEY